MPAKPGSTQIGFVGLGIMGAPMALKLIEAGFSLKVYNRTDRPRVQRVVDAGAERVATPAAAATGSGVLITIVTDRPAVEEGSRGDGGRRARAPVGPAGVDPRWHRHRGKGQAAERQDVQDRWHDMFSMRTAPATPGASPGIVGSLGYRPIRRSRSEYIGSDRFSLAWIADSARPS